ELGVDARHLLHDLGGADERALLAVEELRVRPRLDVMADRRTLALRELLPDRGAVDDDRLVGKALRVLRIQVPRPVDARRGVPLGVLAVLVEPPQCVGALLVLPLEDGRERPVDLPLDLLDGTGVPIDACHGDLRATDAPAGFALSSSGHRGSPYNRARRAGETPSR